MGEVIKFPVKETKEDKIKKSLQRISDILQALAIREIKDRE